MARLVRYVPSLRGIKQLRSSRQVDQMLATRGRAVAAQARLVYAAAARISGGQEIEVDVVQQGSDTSAPRARVAVIARHPAALRIEADQRVLGGALTVAAGVSRRNVKLPRLQISRKAQARADRRAAARERRLEREQRYSELFED